MVRYVIAHFVFSNSDFVHAEMKNKLVNIKTEFLEIS